MAEAKQRTHRRVLTMTDEIWDRIESVLLKARVGYTSQEWCRAQLRLALLDEEARLKDVPNRRRTPPAARVPALEREAAGRAMGIVTDDTMDDLAPRDPDPEAPRGPSF